MFISLLSISLWSANCMVSNLASATGVWLGQFTPGFAGSAEVLRGTETSVSCSSHPRHPISRRAGCCVLVWEEDQAPRWPRERPGRPSSEGLCSPRTPSWAAPQEEKIFLKQRWLDCKDGWTPGHDVIEEEVTFHACFLKLPTGSAALIPYS